MTAGKWVLRLHLVIGAAAGLMLTLTGATGSVLVFGEEIDRALNPSLLRVEPRPQRVSLDDVIADVGATFPNRRIDRIQLPAEPHAPVELCFAEGAEPSCAYADPYTGAPLGTRVPLHSFKGRLFSFHRHLFAGRTGERIVGIEGILLLALSVTGLILWTRSRRRPNPWRSPAASAYVRRHDWHRAVGLLGLPPLVLIAATGTAMVFRPTFEETVNRLASSPTLAPPSVPASASVAHPSVDAALRAVKLAVSDATPTYVIFPASPTAPLAVRARMRGEWLPKGRSFVYLDPPTAEILRVDNALAGPRGYRMGSGLYPLHVGLVGGVTTRVLQCLVGLAPAALCWTGTLMAWRRSCSGRRAPARRVR